MDLTGWKPIPPWPDRLEAYPTRSPLSYSFDQRGGTDHDGRPSVSSPVRLLLQSGPAPPSEAGKAINDRDGENAHDPKADRRLGVVPRVVPGPYGFGMRAAYLPYESREQIERDTRRHRETLNR
jgi:hypothetical protein